MTEERIDKQQASPQAGLSWQIASVVLALAGAIALAWWIASGPDYEIVKRVPVEYPGRAAGGRLVARGDNPGTLVQGPGVPSDLPGEWPQFRRDGVTNIAPPNERLADSWPSDGPETLWRLDVGDGHAGAVVHEGRVYFLDYDVEKEEDALRCLSLETGEEIWRYTYSVSLKRNHGMSRTVVAVNDRFVVGLGPMCHVVALDSKTGEPFWTIDLVEEHGTTVPPWYAGQCPFIDGDKVILAPGADPLMMAVKGPAEGPEVIWETPNPGGWGMSHSSVTPMDLNGRRHYVYSSTSGVVGVDAEDGSILWRTTDWRVPVATIASPVPIGDGRILFSGGYGAGSAMFELEPSGDGYEPRELWRVQPTVFGSTQHTPILYEDHLYNVIPNGELACMDLEGNRLWSSGRDARFELGPFMIADGKIFALDGRSGILRMAEATPDGYRQLAEAKVVDGHDCWAPMALAGGRLILRSMTQMVCLDVGEGGS